MAIGETKERQLDIKNQKLSSQKAIASWRKGQAIWRSLYDFERAVNKCVSCVSNQCNLFTKKEREVTIVTLENHMSHTHTHNGKIFKL